MGGGGVRHADRYPWKMLSLDMGCGSGITCWRFLREQHEAGAWSGLHGELRRRSRSAGRIDWNRACMDSVPLVAKKGEQQNRVEPDRSRQDWHETSSDHRSKRHPARLVLTGTNINDSMPLEELLDSIPSIDGKAGQEQRRPNNLHTDKAYDHRRRRCGGIAPASPGGASKPARSWAATSGPSNTSFALLNC